MKETHQQTLERLQYKLKELDPKVDWDKAVLFQYNPEEE